MPIIALSLDKIHRYVSKQEPDPQDPRATVFVLGTLDARIMARIRDRSTSFEGITEKTNSVHVNVNEMYLEAVRFGLRGWENLLDEHGSPVAFATEDRVVSGKTYKTVSSALLDRLPLDLIVELGEKVVELNSLLPSDAKN